MTASWPEHEKQRPLIEISQKQGEFLEWVMQEKSLVLAEFREGDRGEEVLEQVYVSIEMLLADFHDIDLKKLEAEKREMLRLLGGA